MSLTLPPISGQESISPESGVAEAERSGESVQPREWGSVLCSPILLLIRANSETQALWGSKTEGGAQLSHGGRWTMAGAQWACCTVTSPAAGLTTARRPRGAHREQRPDHPRRKHLRASESRGVHMGSGPPCSCSHVCGRLRD